MSQTQKSSNCLEQLWKPIIRPPRHHYKLKDLGNEVTQFANTITKRTDFDITNDRHQTLCCSLFEPVRIQDKAHPCIIYLHGNSSSRMEALTIVEYLLPFNVSVCGIDLSGSGHSEGAYISLGWYESKDVMSLYDHLRMTQPSITKIGIWGRSMGSVTAMLCASQSPNFKILVCDSPFSNLTNLCKEIAKANYHIPGCIFSCFWCLVKSKIQKEANFNVDDLDIVRVVSGLPEDVSIMFLSAKQDVLIPERHPKLLMEKFKGTKYMQQFDGTHNTRRPQEVMRAAIKYVVNAFGKDAWDGVCSARDPRQIFVTQDKSNQSEELFPIMSDINNTNSRLQKNKK